VFLKWALLTPGRPIRALAIGRVRSYRMGIESIFNRPIKNQEANVASMLRAIASNVASMLRVTSKYQQTSSLLLPCCERVATMLRPCCDPCCACNIQHQELSSPPQHKTQHRMFATSKLDMRNNQHASATLKLDICNIEN
jgi:hypothetical protein